MVVSKTLNREEPEPYFQVSVFRSICGDVSRSEGEISSGSDPFRWRQIKRCCNDEAKA